DNEINQQIAVELLQLAGVQVTLAGNGLQAVERVLAECFDLVLMDLQMPVMDGHEATRRIRAEPQLAGLPIIAMTAHATLEERQRCLDAGMVDHVSKPIDPAQLYAALARHAPKASAPVAAPVAPAPSAEVELPKVDGLDSADGLARMGGNRALYRQLLGRFVELASTPDEIATALSAGDAMTAERLAHTLRGVAGNLGAGGVQAAATSLEQALAARAEPSVLQPLQSQLAQRLDALIAQLRPLLTDSAAARAAPLPDAAEQQQILQSMLAALDQFDVAASELLNTHAALFRALLAPPQYAELVQHIEGYQYPEAHCMLQALVAVP
ncbi:MAG: response regulator, partial [Lysobacterales bacterium]